MKTKAAMLTERNAPWEIMELDVRDPKEGEVLIRYTAAGLCHSDMHLVTGDLPVTAAVHRRTRGRRHHRGGRPGRQQGGQGRSRRLRVHPGVRTLPLVLDRPAEPL